MNRTVGFVVVFLMGMPAYGAVPTLEQLSAVLKNFTFGFEIEFTSERSDRELEEIRDAFGFFTNELDTEKTGNREIRSVPVGGLEELFAQLDAVEKKFPEIIRSVHLHIRFPMKAIRNTRQFEGYVSQMADAISVFRLQNARSTSIALRSDTVRRNGREQIFSRGAVRLQFLEGYDLELRGFMNRISEMKSYLLPLMDAIGHDRFPEGTSEWQSLVTSPRRELGKFLSSEYGLEMNEYNLRRLAIVQNSVIDERAILPLAGFEFSPFVSPESAARIQQANTDFFRSLVSLIQTKSVRDDVLADSSRNLMKRWGEKSGIVEILFAGLDTSETILRSEWRGLELIKSLAAWHESSPRLVRQFFDVLVQQFPDVCQGLITRK